MSRSAGYVLPATILLSLAIMIIAVTLLQFTASSSQTLNNQTYQSIAKEAADAGIEYADSCMKTGTMSWASLTPGTNCVGAGNGGSIYMYQQGTEWRSTFTVSQPDAQNNVLSTGTVQLLSGTTVVQSYTATSKMSIGTLYTTHPVSTGESITDIKNDTTDCAIANGKLYCWGANDTGQLGRGYTGNNSANGTPTVVGGALAGKTVTRVSVGINDVCAIADGTPYCWGSNGNGQLGNEASLLSHPDTNIPTNGVPSLDSSSSLHNKIITDISVSSWNDPANAIWPFATAFSHTCTLAEDGTVSCWGDNGFRQNTGEGPCTTGYFFGIPYESCNAFYPMYGGFNSTPKLTAAYLSGYNTDPYPNGDPNYDSALYGKKAERVGASSHDGCALSNGQLYCWGVQAPLALDCWIPTTGQFSAGWETIIPYNWCVKHYSNGYNASTVSLSSLSGKFIDPNLFNISANEGCWMANTSFVCFGTTPAFDLFWSGAVAGNAWGAPWTVATNWDVTDADNGDSIPSLGLSGLFCIINKGDPECAGSPLNAYTGAASAPLAYTDFQSLVQTGDLASLISTNIAAGQDHGCLVANGQLFCWGNGTYGTLADGNTGLHITAHATSTGKGVIGTASGSYAANGPVSVGGNHACGIANGQLFCWGQNANGQLGMGNTNDVSQPQAVPALTNKYITKVSAGANHTCAIVVGQLYCWGSNSNGQLGLGNTTDYTTPQLIGGTLSGKRVTDVSAGTSDTCAIADGQAYCWGLNSHYQLGLSNTTTYTTPQKVSGHGDLSTSYAVTSLTIGTDHACAVANGDLYCWGDNANGRTGLGTTSGNQSTPELVTGGVAGSPLFTITSTTKMRPLVTDVSAGSNFTCAIINANAACWGSNANGRTGLGLTSGDQTTPATISGPAGGYYATSISAGDSHACAIIDGDSSATKGNSYCWGAGANGRLGNAGTVDQSVAARITGGGTVKGGVRQNVTYIAAGGSSSCAVANGDIMCWGNGANGRLGTGLVSDSSTPSTSSDFRFIAPYQRGPEF